MTGPSVLVVGAGSIGRRHAANLGRLGAAVTVADVDADRLAGVGGPTVVVADTIPAGFDAVVVASPTTLHAAHAASALSTGAFVFVEKPLATTVDDGRRLVELGGDRLVVGYNLRHHTPLVRLVDVVRSGRIGAPVSYRFWFGQWLPDWRPAVDYRTSYSARAELGGGVLFDAIHEVDLAVWLAGPDLAVRGAMVGRVGPLEIDVEDTVRAMLATPEGIPVTIDLDYLSRRYRRGIEVIGGEGTVTFDWATNDLGIATAAGVELVHLDVPVADSYVAEMVELLDLLAGRAPAVNTARSALASLEIAEAIRGAAS